MAQAREKSPLKSKKLDQSTKSKVETSTPWTKEKWSKWPSPKVNKTKSPEIDEESKAARAAVARRSRVIAVLILMLVLGLPSFFF